MITYYSNYLYYIGGSFFYLNIVLEMKEAYFILSKIRKFLASFQLYYSGILKVGGGGG